MEKYLLPSQDEQQPNTRPVLVHLRHRVTDQTCISFLLCVNAKNIESVFSLRKKPSFLTGVLSSLKGRLLDNSYSYYVV